MQFILRILIFFLLLPTLSTHAINFPIEIKREELPVIIESLGYAMSSKFLSNPYPLGGHSGFEVGVSIEIINNDDISELGNGAGKQSDFRYNRITIGKGLYNNFDAYAHFLPYSAANKTADFGGLFRWGFYEGKFSPITVSLLGHLNSTNIQDTFINQNTGLDLMVGVNVSRFAFYLGTGYLRARSIFSTNILDSTNPEFTGAGGVYKLTTSTPRTFVGGHFDIGSFFAVFEMDRYEAPVYSFKLGYRN